MDFACGLNLKIMFCVSECPNVFSFGRTAILNSRQYFSHSRNTRRTWNLPSAHTLVIIHNYHTIFLSQWYKHSHSLHSLSILSEITSVLQPIIYFFIFLSEPHSLSKVSFRTLTCQRLSHSSLSTPAFLVLLSTFGLPSSLCNTINFHAKNGTL
jgi:hypothetical protein